MPIKSIFLDQLTDVTTTPKHNLGDLRVDVDLSTTKLGQRWFLYVQNGSGSSVAADSLVSYMSPLEADVTANGGSTTTATRASGSFITDGVTIGDLVYCRTNSPANGAPEGENSYVTDITATQVTFSPAFTAAVVNGATVNFIQRYRVTAAAANDGLLVAGIPMAAIASLSYGWIQVRGIYLSANIVASGTALAVGAKLVAGAAILIAQTSGTTETSIATALQPVNSGTTRRKAVVMLHCL